MNLWSAIYLVVVLIWEWISEPFRRKKNGR
jgi:hypothetical protein